MPFRLLSALVELLSYLHHHVLRRSAVLAEKRYGEALALGVGEVSGGHLGRSEMKTASVPLGLEGQCFSVNPSSLFSLSKVREAVVSLARQRGARGALLCSGWQRERGRQEAGEGENPRLQGPCRRERQWNL